MPTERLMERRESFDVEKTHTLEFIRPTFNEDMRSGLTNM